MIYGVLVAWRLDVAAVRANLCHLRGQIAALVIVDNSAANAAVKWRALQDDGWTIMPVLNGDNVGVARALNLGIRAALDNGAEFVLLLDEDSAPAPAMVDELVRVWEQCSRRGDRVAAVGANFNDRRTSQRAIFARVRGARIERETCSAGVDCVASDFLISSGSLIHHSLFTAVGLMREDLFVDYVDTEWCWRARSLGYGCFGACRAQMEHGFGDGVLTPPLSRRAVPRRPPLRNYYIFRNTLLLLRAGHIPWRWKVNALQRLALLFGVYLTVAADRIRHGRMIFRGIVDGVAGRGGRLADDRSRAGEDRQ